MICNVCLSVCLSPPHFRLLPTPLGVSLGFRAQGHGGSIVVIDDDVDDDVGGMSKTMSHWTGEREESWMRKSLGEDMLRLPRHCAGWPEPSTQCERVAAFVSLLLLHVCHIRGNSIGLCWNRGRD